MFPIIAISTSLNNSAIGIIRISFGNNNLIDFDIYFNKIFKKKLKPRYATFVNFYYKNKIIDNGIAIFFNKPFSYTGEDLLEFHGHGNYFNLNYILKIFLIIFKKNKIRIAKRGEFTKRAFLNKKIDSFYIENLLNLINTNNNYSLKFIHNNFTNNLYFKFNKLFNFVINIKDIIKNKIYNNSFLDSKLVNYKINYILKKIFEIYNFIKISNFDNLSIILLGSPNTGKSTIINKLINKKSLIVSSIPGTTRDLVNRTFNINNLKVDIYDTAGLHFKINKLEKKGIKIAFKQLKNSNIIIYVLDERFKINIFLKKILTYLNNFNIFLLIFNKIDLFLEIVSLEIFLIFNIKNINVKISAKYNLGINILYIELGRLILNFNNFNFNKFIHYKYVKNIYILLNKFSKFSKNYKNKYLLIIINNLINYFKKILFLKKNKLNSLFKKFCIGK
ncbi:GTPase and tRNA-U34 5-formylation enzyme TrmE [Candidatus Nasuia deltocephalinicola]|nr:GTPase and tRNA-U34 5-formylation enzyme TrmE [Candidatus Nasuia deltocephalinicola]